MLDQAGRKAAVARRAGLGFDTGLALLPDLRLSHRLGRQSYTALIGRKNPLSSLRIAV